MLIFFWNENVRILSFLLEHYSGITDIIKNYLLPNSTALKLSNWKYEFVAAPK